MTARWPPSIMRGFLALLVVAASLLSACVNQPTQPRALSIPAANAPQIFAIVDATTKPLDCLNAAFRTAGAHAPNKKTIVSLGPMTTAVPKVGRVELPASLQPFVRAALDRVSSGIEIVDGPNVHLRFSGSLYAGAPFRVLENEAETFGFGVGTHVEAVDVNMQLFLEARVRDPKAKGNEYFFQQSGSSISFVIRLYSAEQGASAFRITSGSNGLVMARSRAAQEAAPAPAIHSATNIAVAILLKARGVRDWGVAADCNYHDAPNLAIPRDTAEPDPSIFRVELALLEGRLCAGLKPITETAAMPPGPLRLEVLEQRADGIEIRRRTVNVAPIADLLATQRAVCIPKGAIDARTEAVEFRFSSNAGRHLGGGSYVFQ